MDIPVAPDAAHDCDRLSFGGRFLLWFVRIWVTGYHQQRPTSSHVHYALRVLDGENGGQVLNRLLTLDSGACRPSDIRPPCYRQLPANERRILDIVRFIQAGDEAGGLSALVKPSARSLVQPLDPKTTISASKNYRGTARCCTTDPDRSPTLTICNNHRPRYELEMPGHTTATPVKSCYNPMHFSS